MALAYGLKLALITHKLQAWAALWAVVVGICFVIQPALTLALAVLLAYGHPTARGCLTGVLLLGSLYLALINVTKMPESDLANYLESFRAAQQQDLGTFMQIYTREPLYFASLFFLANLPGVDGRIYLFLSTLVPYLVFGAAVLRLGTALRLERRSLMSLLVFLLFFGQLFSLSAHLLRQFMASSIAMLFLVDHAITNRRRWGLGLLGIMVHYSCMPLVLLSVMQPFKRYPGVLSVLFHVLLLLVIYLISIQIAPLLFDVPVLGMVFQRIANGAGAELNPLPFTALAAAVFLLAISIFTLARTQGQVLGVRNWSLMLCTAIVSLVVLVSSSQPTLSEIANRYFFYLYFLIGLVLVFPMRQAPVIRMAMHVLALLTLPFFFYKLANGEWTYAPLGSLLFQPAWILWGYQVRTEQLPGH